MNAKQKKTLAIMCVLLVLACAAYFVATMIASRANRDDGTDEPSDITLVDRSENDVTKVTLSSDGSELSISRDGIGYVLEGETDFPIDPEAASELFATLAKVTAKGEVTENTDDLGAFGLAEPKVVAKALYSGGEEIEFRLGSFNKFTGAHYLTTGDGRIYMIEGYIPDTLAYGKLDFIKKDKIPTLNAENVKSIAISYGGKSRYELTRTGDGKWTRTLRDGTTEDADAENSEALAKEASEVYFTAVEAYNVTKEMRGKYGFDVPTAHVTVSYATALDEGTYEFYVGDAANESASSYYITLGDSLIVYRITSASISNILGFKI